MSELAQEPIWYHKMNLGGVETRLIQDWSAPWAMIREVRKGIAYPGKRVLDLASFDGMWAFEAEQLGASFVVASDCIDLYDKMQFVARAYEKFLYSRSKLNSRVMPYYNVSVHHLDRLLPFVGGRFDIIQNLGLLYHVENPWQALKQCRQAIVSGGFMLVETACSEGSEPAMRLNLGPNRFYRDDRTYWAPTKECLTRLLEACGFRLFSLRTVKGGEISRIAFIAEAVDTPPDFNNDYRSL